MSTIEKVGFVESVDTTPQRDAFEEQVRDAKGDRTSLLALRDLIVGEMGHHKQLLTRTRAHQHRSQEYISAELYALLEDNVRVMGGRVMRVQNEITALNDERRQEGRAANESFLRAFISEAKKTLPSETYEGIFQAARDRAGESE